MADTAAEQLIVHHCVDEDGFLMGLRTKARFDQQGYVELLQAIAEYRDAVSGSRTMSRRVAGCLHDLVLLLGDLAHDARAEAHSWLSAEAVASAHAQCWELVEDVFWLEPSTILGSDAE